MPEWCIHCGLPIDPLESVSVTRRDPEGGYVDTVFACDDQCAREIWELNERENEDFRRSRNY